MTTQRQARSRYGREAKVRTCQAPVARSLTTVLPLLFGAASGHAAEIYHFPASAPEQGRLVIHAATDRTAIEPLLRDFQSLHPGVAITYADFNTNELYTSIVEPQHGAVPDLAISSAMDLQAKLVNDGWTQPHVSDLTARLPAWANWRDEAFGFTFEPAVIVAHRDTLPEAETPRSRAALTRQLLEHPDRWRGRVATYDIAVSGVGYLFATRDSVLSDQFWQLIAAFGHVQTRLLATSAEILDTVERGDAMLGYNVLGSYAQARVDAGASIRIIYPEDYTLVMSRVVTIPEAARSPDRAKLFVDYLLSERGQAVVAGASGRQIILPHARGDDDVARSLPDAQGPVQPIELGPALLVFLDPSKKARFLRTWRLSLQPP